jgi:hypothetical protein
MPPRTMNPQYSQWFQDFFGTEGELPSAYQGAPLYGDYEWWEPLDALEVLNSMGFSYSASPQASEYLQMPTLLESSLSSYPGYKEEHAVLDYMIGGEKIRGTAETERFKLQDLLESVQTTGPEGLRVGGVSRELENQRKVINQGLVDLEAKKSFGLKAQETELAGSLVDLRANYEMQIAQDYLNFMQDYAGPVHADQPVISVTTQEECEASEYGEWHDDIQECHYPSIPPIEIPEEPEEVTCPDGCKPGVLGGCVGNDWTPKNPVPCWGF